MALDQDVVNLAKAIRQHESGNKAQLPGEGAELGGKSLYQYTHGTWKSVAGKYLGDQNAQLTRENENKATYLRIADWKKQGYNPAQIASMWNAGEGRPNAYKENWRGVNKYGVKFDTPAYVAKVYDTYKQEKAKTTPPQPTPTAQPIQQPQAPVKKQSFFEKAGDVSGKILSAGASMLGIPALIENIASIGEAGAYGVNKLLGREQQAQQILDNPISAPQKMAATQGTAAGIKNALGNTIEAGLGASVLATGGLGAAAKGTQVATKAPGFFKTIGTGAKLGAGYGAGFGVAEGLKQNLDTPSIIGEGLKSGVTGGILGGGLGIAGYGLSKVAGKVATSAAAKKAGISTKEMGNIAKVEEELYNIENNYAKLRKVNQFEKDAGAASRRRIAESNVLAGSIDENGRIITKSIDGPIERYKDATIGEYENLVGKLLEKEGAKVTPAFIAKKLQDTLMKSGLEGNALKTALSRIESEVQGLMLRADQNGLIPLPSVHYAKIATTKGINYATEPFVAAERKAIARAYKELVEQVSKENIKPINKEIQKYLKDIKLLENLDGKIVKGGKLGKYFSQIAGNLSGAAVGGAIGGPLGMVSGTVAGGEIASRIKGKTIQGILGRGQFKAPKKSGVLQKALNESEARVKVTQKGGRERVPVEVMPEDRPGRLLPPPRPKVNVLPKENVIQVGAPKSVGEKTKENIGILAKRLKESNVKSAGVEHKGGQKYYSGRNGDMATAENTGMYGNGAYLTSDVKRAKLYGETIDEFSVEGLKLYEPKDTIKELFGRDTNYGDSALITKKYKDLGYDGLKIGGGKDKEIVVFDPKKLNKQLTASKPEKVDNTNQLKMPKNLKGIAKELGLTLKDESVYWLDEVMTNPFFSGEQIQPTKAIINDLSRYRPQKPIKVYRGIRKGESQSGHKYESWTTDKNVAKDFSNGGTVLEKVVKPNDVIVDTNKIPRAIKDKMGLFTDEKEVIIKTSPKGILKDKPGFIGQDNTSPILQEAKKYKSAEEFIDAVSGNSNFYNKDYRSFTEKNRLASEPYDFDLMERLGSTPETKGDLVKVYRKADNEKLLPGDNVSIYDFSKMSTETQRKMGVDEIVGDKKSKLKEFWINKKDLYNSPAGTQIYAPNGNKSLTDIWNKAQKLKSSSQSAPLVSKTDDLVKEARKYKSSKEFIEALDINYRDNWKGNKDKDADRLLALFDGKVFHGTNAADEIIKKGYKKGNYFNSGAYFSDMPDEAIGYMKQGRSSGGKSSSVLVNDLSNLKIKMQEGTDGDIIRKINKLEPGIEEYVLKLKKQGYDGIKSRWGETLVWNTQKIKTPERLEDIWKQANNPNNKPGYIGSDFAKNKAKQEFGKTGTGMLTKGAAVIGTAAIAAPVISNVLKDKTPQQQQLEVVKEKMESTKDPEKPKTKDEEIEDYVKNINVTINKGRADLGNTLAEENNNPGNLKFAGQPNAKKNGAYAQFPTPELGFRALIKDVQSKQKKGLTLEEMMNIYAPPEENDTEAYLDALEGWLNVKRTDKASEIDPIELAKRIAKFESQTVIE